MGSVYLACSVGGPRISGRRGATPRSVLLVVALGLAVPVPLAVALALALAGRLGLGSLLRRGGRRRGDRRRGRGGRELLRALSRLGAVAGLGVLRPLTGVRLL